MRARRRIVLAILSADLTIPSVHRQKSDRVPAPQHRTRSESDDRRDRAINTSTERNVGSDKLDMRAADPSGVSGDQGVVSPMGLP